MMVMIAATLCAHRKFNDAEDVDSDGGELGAAAVVDDDDADGDGGELGAAAVVSWCVCCKGCLYTSPDIVLYTMHQTSSWRRSCAIMRVRSEYRRPPNQLPQQQQHRQQPLHH